MTARRRRIRTVLIANRGEIAVRVIRACREMGLHAAVVYAPVDREALHVREADRAFEVPSYLDQRAICRVAQAAGADAIHPGYGFLAEQAAFAARVERAGLVFVGPPPNVIRRMGSKIAARRVAERAGIPVVPGTVEPVRDAAAARRIAARIGYPVLLKAIAGGGGKGMRLARDAKELAAIFRVAATEAAAAFGDGALYLERYLSRPHHVEVQILADRHGSVIHCFERECSIQRRHQKIIEETPSPFLKPATRAAICTAAVRFAAAGGYVNAGTVEFLVDVRQRFYFLEMNTRIQVEHPITEWVTGIDLVQAQLRIAMGHALPWRQETIVPRGHAVECRIYAENPFAGFLPSPGTITALVEPHGPGVRMDTGVAAGSDVPIDFDPILGKLSVWGATRAAAIRRMTRALREYRIRGIQTNLAFHERVLNHPLFRAGGCDTHFVDRELRRLTAIGQADEEEAACLAAVAATLRSGRRAVETEGSEAASPWVRAARQEGLRHGVGAGGWRQAAAHPG